MPARVHSGQQVLQNVPDESGVQIKTKSFILVNVKGVTIREEAIHSTDTASSPESGSLMDY